MKALKLKFFQETACYKKPFAFKVAETYPLPPYSTVKGFLHYILNADDFINMAISVQGDYEDKFINLQTFYFYKEKEITKCPLNVHYLHNVELLIHIFTKEEILDSIIKNIKNSNEFFSLGRREDIVRIDDIKKVEFKEIDLDEEDDIYILKHSAYIPKFYNYDALTGINYNLNFKYDMKNEIREWEKVKVIYVEKGSNAITNGKIYLDEAGDIIFLNKKVEEIK